MALGLQPLHARDLKDRSAMNLAFEKGEALFQAGQYASSSVYFEDVLAARDTMHLHYRDAVFYAAACALQLGRPDGAVRLEQFVDRYPEHPLYPYACVYLGDALYRDGRYAEALGWYEQVDISRLRQDEKAVYQYKMGYAYRMTDDMERAVKHFMQVDSGSSYAEDAQLYLALGAYDAGRFDEARTRFSSLEGSPKYGTAAAYYMAHMLFDEARYQELIDYTKPLLITDMSYQGGLYRVVAAAYNRLGNYNKAVLYWDAFAALPDAEPLLSDYYEMGCTQYALERYEKAGEYFEKAMADSTRIGQNAAYHLAGCYLAMLQKPKALAAFHAAAQSTADAAVREEALFQEAVLTYELQYGAYNDIIQKFTTFLEQYPTSSHATQASSYLATAYGETRNYAAALEALRQADLSLDYVGSAYQRVAFFRAIELFQTGEPAPALELLSQSQQYSRYNSDLALRANFWMAEAEAALGRPQDAVTHYKQFLSGQGAPAAEEYAFAYYGLGYSYFALKQYTEATSCFQQFTGMVPASDAACADARNRLGDCLFMQKQYAQALEAYRQVAAQTPAEADYALFQEGFCLGLLGDQQAKIATLDALTVSHPQSSYVDDALYETGRALMSLQRLPDAVTRYRRVVDEFPQSSFRSKALSQLGLASYNQGDADAALRYYRQVVDEYPNSAEARSALLGIRSIYIDRDDADAFVAYTASLKTHQVDFTEAAQDSLTYSVAEKIYMEGRTDAAREALDKYLARYPEGIFAVPAHYYAGECHAAAGHQEVAASHYEQVVKAPRNLFTEQALAALAALCYSRGEDEAAFNYYRQLADVAEVGAHVTAGRMGMLRAAFRMQQYQTVVQAADEVAGLKGVPDADQREARFKAASSLLALRDTTKALPMFKALAAEALSAEGAESNYRLAELLYLTRKYSAAEQAVFDFAQKNTSQTYWTAKSFVILARVYIATGDLFQASHTVQSVLDNYAGSADDVLDEARTVKNQITQLEQKQNNHASEQ